MTQQGIPTEQQVKDVLIQQLNNNEITREQAAQKMSAYRKIVSGQAPAQQVIATPAQTAPPEPGLGERMAGNFSALANVAAGSGIEIAAGLGGLAVGAVTQDANQAGEAVRNIQSLQESIPTTQVGKQRLEQLGGLVKGIVDKVNQPLAIGAGVKIFFHTGDLEGS